MAMLLLLIARLGCILDIVAHRPVKEVPMITQGCHEILLMELHIIHVLNQLRGICRSRPNVDFHHPHAVDGARDHSQS
eukprot:6247735-Pyramimonas_sp.AAC.1